MAKPQLLLRAASGVDSGDSGDSGELAMPNVAGVVGMAAGERGGGPNPNASQQLLLRPPKYWYCTIAAGSKGQRPAAPPLAVALLNLLLSCSTST